MSYNDFPAGTFRTQTASGTISNFAGDSRVKGSGPVRIYSVFLSVLTTGSTATLTLYNGSSAVTSNAYITVRCQREFEATFDSHAGVLFPSGCQLLTGAAIDYATIVWRNETF